MKYGGVPERSNGAVLKTAGGRKVARGFKSHPRRLNSRNPSSHAGLRLGSDRRETVRLRPRFHALTGGQLADAVASRILV
jgi:hypothetical protein